MKTLHEINERLTAIKTEVEKDDADYDALLTETRSLHAERDTLIKNQEQRKKLLDSIADGTADGIEVMTRKTSGGGIEFIKPGSESSTPQLTRNQLDNKFVFRSGENVADKYPADIDLEKVLRSAITGNRNDLNEVELRALTPANTGAILAPEISARLIDNLRQLDWMQLFKPTIIMMQEGETKIPKIDTLPAAIMHIPGEKETPDNPVITAATLRAQTIMVLVEVANELLQDASTSHFAITEACLSAMSNKLLQQALYGTGTGAEIKGVTKYTEESFADSGSKESEADLFRLVTLAKTAIIKKNGFLNAMIYDPDLEDRLNKRLPNGELIAPSRAFTELYEAGRIMAHPSISAGDMLFLQENALFLGVRERMSIEIDRSSAFDSNNTKFRLIMRADIYANAQHMAYYKDITPAEPTPPTP